MKKWQFKKKQLQFLLVFTNKLSILLIQFDVNKVLMHDDRDYLALTIGASPHTVIITRSRGSMP